MNFNAIIAVLILKAVITQEEGEALVEHLNDKPQSTVLRDSIAQIAEIIGKPQPLVVPQLGPVGPAQHAEEMAARTQPAPPLMPAVAAPVGSPSPNEPQNQTPPAPVEEPQTDEKPAEDTTKADEETKSTESETDKPSKASSTEKPKEAAKKK